MRVKYLMLFIIPVLSGCSLHWAGFDAEGTKKGLYKAFQPDMQSCQKVPQYQRSDCEKRVQESLSYEEYQKIHK